MRSKTGGASKPASKRVRFDKRGDLNEVMDITDIINGILGPASQAPLPTFTVFSLSESEAADHIVQHLFRECPSMTSDKMSFVQSMVHFYERYKGDEGIQGAKPGFVPFAD